MTTEDTKEKILEEWNETWSKPPFNKMEVAKKVHFTNIDDLYRHLLRFAKSSGNPLVGKGKKQLRESEQQFRQSGSRLAGKDVNGRHTIYIEQWSEEKKTSNTFKIMTDYLQRVRKWKKQKRSTT